MKNKLVIIFLSLTGAFAQFAPVPDSIGTTAIHKDSSIIVAWADYAEVQRGYQNIAQPSLGLTNTGNAYLATGPADGSGVVSLGDGGIAIVGFWEAIQNGPGPDFAVFENGFDDYFLELAFVEVSTDGINYVRFPATSLTQTQTNISGFDSLQCTQINNLAGKYRNRYGTPFDLEELKDAAGIDVNNIHFIKIIDVIGSTDPAYASYDHLGNVINDPFPTPFPQGGFDLDAVAKINGIALGLENKNNISLHISPNPVLPMQNINFTALFPDQYQLFDLQGKMIQSGYFNAGNNQISISSSGIYLLHYHHQTFKVCVQ